MSPYLVISFFLFFFDNYFKTYLSFVNSKKLHLFLKIFFPKAYQLIADTHFTFTIEDVS